MRFAPHLDAGNVTIDLQSTLPREQVATHEEVVESNHAHEAKQFGHCLDNDTVFEIVCLHGLVNIVEEGEKIFHALGRCIVGSQELQMMKMHLMPPASKEHL
jgi:hypothetical protein